MRNSSLVILCAGALAAPALSQGMPDGMPDHHGSLPGAPPAEAPAPGLSAEQQAALAAWPPDVQEYYRSLPPPRQETFWLLTDEYKVKLAGMDETQRVAAWEQIEQKLQERADAMTQKDKQPESEPQ
ncbi:hypothetical protein LY632_07150 [Erythrobacter sp. SDW2]|uniref:hypothetical protein n=1 Tax=Erythrobacter sp. SDW2 TaxID=2907154 RepID=UPI001F32537F|nr:hypothetical protein [Erythrobacter sp. SDW2]UIP08163.1 hypothetical protein LY632_07150 [Erythrobacter sp. SDW2]